MTLEKEEEEYYRVVADRYRPVYEDWIPADIWYHELEWNFSEVILLLMDLDPKRYLGKINGNIFYLSNPDSTNPEEYPNKLQIEAERITFLLNRSIEFGTIEYEECLPSRKGSKRYRISPREVIRWARSKKTIKVPEEFLVPPLFRPKKDEKNLVEKKASGAQMNVNKNQLGSKDSIPCLVFKKTDDNRWVIGLTGKENIYDDLDGFVYIHYLLNKPNEHIKSVVLYDLKPKHDMRIDKSERIKQEFDPSTLKPLEKIDKKTLQQIKNRITELEKEEERLLKVDAYSDQDIAENSIMLKEIQEEKKKINDYLKDNTYKGKRKHTDTVQEKCRQKVQKAIMFALNKIATKDVETVDLIKNIEKGYQCKILLNQNIIKLELE